MVENEKNKDARFQTQPCLGRSSKPSGARLHVHSHVCTRSGLFPRSVDRAGPLQQLFIRLRPPPVAVASRLPQRPTSTTSTCLRCRLRLPRPLRLPQIPTPNQVWTFQLRARTGLGAMRVSPQNLSQRRWRKFLWPQLTRWTSKLKQVCTSLRMLIFGPLLIITRITDGLIYLPEIKYRRILNKAFGPGGWGLAPRSETNVSSKVVSREYALVCLGR